jgi:hypothetical protein
MFVYPLQSTLGDYPAGNHLKCVKKLAKTKNTHKFLNQKLAYFTFGA